MKAKELIELLAKDPEARVFFGLPSYGGGNRRERRTKHYPVTKVLPHGERNGVVVIYTSRAGVMRNC